MTKRRWSDLPRWQRASALALAPLEVVTTTVAVIDLVRRPRPQVRGPKPLWFLGFLVQPIGPIAYLRWGRRSS